MSSRRTYLAAAAAAGSMAIAATGLTGCGAGATATGPAATPRYGGAITLGTTGEPDSWDPHVSVSTLSALALRPVYDSLVHEKADGSVEPWLASSWDVSGDGLRYTFHLRDDVTFSDGTKFDAASVRANFDHVVDPATKSRNAKTLLGPYDHTEVKDPSTAVVVLSKPDSPFLDAVSTPYLGIASTKALADPTRIAAGGPGVVGSGPFVFSDLKHGQQATFTRRPGYHWGPQSGGEAYLDSYTVQFLSDDAARVGSLTSGQLDVADQVPATRVAGLRGQPGITLVQKDNLGAPFTYNLNVTKAPLDDRNVRLAVQSAVDTDGITKGLFQGQYSRAWSVLTPSTPGYAKSVEGTWGHDLGKANSLLDQSGWTGRDADGYRTKNGERLRLTLAYAAEFTTKEQLDYHTALQDALKKAGVELVLSPQDTATIVKTFSGGDYHLGAFSSGAADGSLLRSAFYSTNLPAAGGSNVSRINDPEIDGWLDEALRIQGAAGQNALYAKVQQKVLAEGLILPTYVVKRTFATGSRVHDFALDAQNLPDLARTWVG